jgi:3-hydroxybutyryl-CoA dehydrogenase
MIYPFLRAIVLGLPSGMVVIRMVEQGVAPTADLDSTIVHGYRHPVDPLRLTDMVGLDLRLAIEQYLRQTLGAPQFEPPETPSAYSSQRSSRQESGCGFFHWDD